MPDAWNPQQYGKFSGPRSRPFFDLLALVQPAEVRRVVDLGCGTGELTAEMHRRLGADETVGLDNSEAMLAQARPLERPGLHFLADDITGFVSDKAQAGQFDLVFSNAALHWVPQHELLWRQLVGLLRPAGQLAVQMPAMHEHPAHRLAAELAASPRFTGPLGGYVYQSDVRSIDTYAEWLDALGCREQQVRMQIYGHHLASRVEVADWLAGSLLTTYEQRLNSQDYAEFLAAFRKGLCQRLPDRQPFFYPYRRILLWGRF